MLCTIMQPTYLPWAGYFNLISQADEFVFLDDAQFQKNSWHNRNRILLNNTPRWITVPIKHNALEQKINETLIIETQPWRKKQCRQIQQTYAKHPFAADVLTVTEVIESELHDNLASQNMRIIQWVMSKLGINTPIHLSSKMNCDGKRTDKLIQLLQELHAETYLSPQGAMDYLTLDDFTELTKIKLEYQSFEPATYTQFRHEGFESHLSIIDVVANIGWEGAKQYVK